jgi:outer membrane protein TolC
MKTIHKIHLIVLIFFSGISITEAQQPRLSLDSVIANINNNPQLQVYNAQIAAQEAFAKGARNFDPPKISAGQYQTPYAFSPNMGSFMITGEQMFTNPAKLRAKENYLKGQSKVTASEMVYSKNQLIAEAKQYYFEAVVFEKKLLVLAKNRELFEYMIKDANLRLTYGKEKLGNIYKAKAALYELDNIQEQTNNSMNQRKIMLNTLMNKNESADFSVDTNIIIKDYEATITDTATLANKRTDIASLNQSIALQTLNTQMEYSKRKPDFGLQAGHMFSYGGYPNQYILMGSITLPLVVWAAKENRANLQGMKQEAVALQFKKWVILNQAQGRLAVIKTDLKSKKKQLENYQMNIIPAFYNNYKTQLLAYEQNTGDLASVLDSIKELQTAQMDALDKLQEIAKLQVDYEKETN